MINAIEVSIDAFKVLKNLSSIGPKHESSTVAVEYCDKDSVNIHLRKGSRRISREFSINELVDSRVELLGYHIEQMLHSLEKQPSDNN
jgi:pyridoxine 5'-phosphate synthase PdxJ